MIYLLQQKVFTVFTCRQMDYSDRTVCGVDMLTSSSTRSLSFYLQVLRVYRERDLTGTHKHFKFTYKPPWEIKQLKQAVKIDQMRLNFTTSCQTKRLFFNIFAVFMLMSKCCTSKMKYKQQIMKPHKCECSRLSHNKLIFSLWYLYVIWNNFHHPKSNFNGKCIILRKHDALIVFFLKT